MYFQSNGGTNQCASGPQQGRTHWTTTQILTIEDFPMPVLNKNHQSLLFDELLPSSEGINARNAMVQEEKLFEKLIDGEYNDNDPVHVRKVQQLLQEERKQRKELQRLRKIVSSLEQQYESMKDTVNPSFANNNNHHDPIESTTTQDF
mmetsp:Transcript_5157/g.19340  ORF Transcript_5157/g.19340 Transcript_5157/m.19340 type:complete len:148 (+) Transcript_5157:3016-3459(+)